MRIDPRKQFSKRLARWTTVYWFVFMTWLSIILAIQPAAAEYSVYMAIIATVVMIVNVVSYTRNSIIEKAIFGMIEKTKLEVSIGNPSKGSDENVAEGESNG